MLPSLGVGVPIGDRSDSVRTGITPAGWAFSIWGPLYAGSFAYAVYQLLPPQRDNPLLAKIGWASSGAFLGNAAWALYTQFFGLSVLSAVIIVFTLCCLLYIYFSFSQYREHFTRAEQFLVVLPLSALASWLTVATIVNVTAAAKYHGLDFGNATGAVGAAIVAVAGVIASTAIWAGRGNPWYALVFLWALVAIYSAGGQEWSEIGVAAVASAIAVVATTVVRLIRPYDRDRWFAAHPT
jgi:hypothetical protein